MPPACVCIVASLPVHGHACFNCLNLNCTNDYSGFICSFITNFQFKETEEISVKLLMNHNRLLKKMLMAGYIKK